MRVTPFCIFSALLLALPQSSPRAKAQSAVADFREGANFPLVKKFDWMNSRYLNPDRYAATPALDYLKQAGTRSLRIEVGWGVGGSYTDLIGGTANHLTYDFKPMDLIAREMKKRGLGLYWSYGYNPPPLQGCNNDPKGTPCDLDQWKNVLRTMAQHWKSKGLRPDFQGVWNEPDYQPYFYTGDLASFKLLYEYGSKGLREGDADAVVGGPDFADSKGDSWLDGFLDHVSATRSPMDFLSYHSLDASDEARLAPKRAALKSRPYFHQTELVVGELNPYDTATYHDQAKSVVSDWPSCAAALDVLSYYVKTPEVTRTFWAQGIAASDGDALAAITYSGSARRPVYWAHFFYNQMPVDRVVVEARGVKALASTNKHVAALLMWAPERGKAQHVTATFRNVPFAAGQLEVWRVDASHNSIDTTGHDFDAPEVLKISRTRDYQWRGQIPAGGTVLLKMRDRNTASAHDPYTMGTLIRQHHYFPHRGDQSYGVFDPASWIARLGMAGNDYAAVEEGALYQNLPESLSFDVQTEGKLRALGENSVLSVNLDYRVDGIYAKSVMLHGGLYNARRSSAHPFGKKGLADQVVKVRFPKFTIRLADYAPPGWKSGGDVLVSYTMQNTGADTRAKITVRRSSARR